MTIEISYLFRFQTRLANQRFLTEVPCENLAEAKAIFAEMAAETLDIELTAAMLYFQLLSAQAQGNNLPDETSLEILTELCAEIGVCEEEFWNASIGSFDPITNRVTPVNLGTVFPDGTYRVMWDTEKSTQGFDDALRILTGALLLLSALQGLDRFNATDDEIEANDRSSFKARRVSVLFEAGLWPDSDSQFPEDSVAVDDVMQQYLK